MRCGTVGRSVVKIINNLMVKVLCVCSVCCCCRLLLLELLHLGWLRLKSDKRRCDSDSNSNGNSNSDHMPHATCHMPIVHATIAAHLQQRSSSQSREPQVASCKLHQPSVSFPLSPTLSVSHSLCLSSQRGAQLATGDSRCELSC